MRFCMVSYGYSDVIRLAFYKRIPTWKSLVNSLWYRNHPWLENRKKFNDVPRDLPGNDYQRGYKMMN